MEFVYYIDVMQCQCYFCIESESCNCKYVFSYYKDIFL